MQRAGVRPNVVMRAESVEAVKNAVREGSGIGMLYRDNVRSEIEMLREYSISWHGNADYVINHQVPETGNTALHRAAWNSDRQMMETLINAGADQTLLNNDRKTANELLNQRLEPVHQRLREACSKGDLDGVNKALQSGADPNAKDEFDNTALHYAARNGTPTLMQVLIGSGANPNVANSEGKTPLDIWKSK